VPRERLLSIPAICLNGIERDKFYTIRVGLFGILKLMNILHRSNVCIRTNSMEPSPWTV